MNNLNPFYDLDMPVPKQYRHNPLFISLFAEASGTKSFTVTYMTYDGSSVITTETVKKGESGTVTNTTAREQDEQYTYAPDGWATSPNGDKEADALTNITENKTVYAAYTKTLRTFTVEFCRASADGGGTLQTLHNVEYGTVLSASSYTGATPTTTKGDAADYPFEGWTPAFAPITGNTVYTAKFGEPIDVSEIADSWDTIIANIDNGTYSTRYKIGQYKPLDLGTEGTINMQIVAIDGDELADGSGYAPLTFIGMELLATSIRMNPARSPSSAPYTEGTGTIGGWELCELRTYLKNTIKPLIPSAVRSRINNVIKYSRIYNTAGSAVTNVSSTDDVWIPSKREMVGVSNNTETQGPIYSTIFSDNASRIKSKVGTSVAINWWLRSAYSATSFSYVNTDGALGNHQTTSSYNVCLGFCLGLEPETITDDWSTILANTNPSATYSIGDTKYLDLGTEGKHLMEIVAFNADELADGTGYAKITWISKTLLNGPHRMNPNLSGSSGAYTEGTGTIGGWDKSEMKQYILNTIVPKIPTEVRNAVKTVKKYTRIYTTTGGVVNDVETNETFWLPSKRELFDGTTSTFETKGPRYSEAFPDNASRVKSRVGGSSVFWWLRSPGDNNKFYNVQTDGSVRDHTVYISSAVALGFCTN